MLQTTFDLWYFLIGSYVQYILIAGIAYLLFWIFLKDRFMHLFIQKKFPKRKQINQELKYSFIALTITKLFGLTVILSYNAGYTFVYSDPNEYGTFYYYTSFLLTILIHDTYFYWTHRLMHHPKLYRKIHLVHHKSVNPSPWAAFSFHPYEALITGAIVIILPFCMPVHKSVIFAFFIFSLIKNVIGHLGFEFFPSGFTRNKFFGFNTTSTHHNMHHKKFNGNYGFYFTFWDRIMKTEVPHYHEEFEEVVNRERSNLQVEWKKVE